jgi:hypothetical protein
MPSVLLNSPTKYSNRVLSKSSPPRKVSPFVALTWQEHNQEIRDGNKALNKKNSLRQ